MRHISSRQEREYYAKYLIDVFGPKSFMVIDEILYFEKNSRKSSKHYDLMEVKKILFENFEKPEVKDV